MVPVSSDPSCAAASNCLDVLHVCGEMYGLSPIVFDLAAQFGVEPFQGIDSGLVFHALQSGWLYEKGTHFLVAFAP